MSLQRFEGSNIEAVLEEAKAVGGPGVRIVEANRLRRGGIGGFFTKERFEVAIEVDDDAPVPAAEPATTVAPQPARTRRFGVDPVLALADEVSDVELAASLSTEQDSFAELLGRISREVQDSAAAEPEAEPVPEPEPEPVYVAPAPRPEPVVLPPQPRPAPLPALASPVPSHVGLVRLGLPSQIVPVGDDTASDLLQALSTLPAARPVPRAAGEVFVVVGERDAALGLARTLADEMGLAPDEVVLAAEGDDGDDLPLGCLLPSVPAVADERCSARWRRRPSLVVVASPVRPGASTFGRRALEALEPTATWGAVPASAKPEDVLAWSDSLGGLDAVSVDGLDDTSTPASILGTGIPVARLDGRPASPALWTALLMERLAA